MSHENRLPLQEVALSQLSLRLGGASLAVRDGFEDGHIDVTRRSGACWRISANGWVTPQAPNHSIRWTDV